MTLISAKFIYTIMYGSKGLFEPRWQSLELIGQQNMDQKVLRGVSKLEFY